MPLKVEPHAEAYQLLLQIEIGIKFPFKLLNTASCLDISHDNQGVRRVIEEVVFNERAKLRGPIVVCARDSLPRQVRERVCSGRLPKLVGRESNVHTLDLEVHTL